MQLDKDKIIRKVKLNVFSGRNIIYYSNAEMIRQPLELGFVNPFRTNLEPGSQTMISSNDSSVSASSTARTPFSGSEPMGFSQSKPMEKANGSGTLMSWIFSNECRSKLSMWLIAVWFLEELLICRVLEQKNWKLVCRKRVWNECVRFCVWISKNRPLRAQSSWIWG